MTIFCRSFRIIKKQSEVPVEPALMLVEDAVEKLPPYDIGTAEMPFYRALAAYAIQWIHLPTETSVTGVSVS